MSKNLMARISVAIVAVPAILWIGYQGGLWLSGMVTIFALFAITEFLFQEGFRPREFQFWLGILMVILLLLSKYGVTWAWFYPVHVLFSSLSGILVFFLISAMLFSIGTRPPSELFQRHTRLFWGVFYVGILYPFVYLVAAGYEQLSPYNISGGDWLLYLFGLLWVGDTAAMGIGKWIGRHKLAPAVSPNKTVEGFIGGILGSLAVGLLMVFWKFQQLPWYHVMVLAVGCSVFGQLGDLVESMWKRSLGIKDSSAIIPGHGGVLDRFDSLLFAAPFMFFYKLLIILP